MPMSLTRAGYSYTIGMKTGHRYLSASNHLGKIHDTCNSSKSRFSMQKGQNLHTTSLNLSAAKSQKSQQRKSKLLIGNLLLGCGVLSVFIYVYTKKNKRAKELHIDMDFGASGRMIKRSGYLLPEFTSKSLDTIKSFEVRDTDLFVCSFPKSGTTWVQYIVQLLEQECGILPASNLEGEFPYMEYVYPGVKAISAKQGTRRIKTHLPLELLPADVVDNGKGKVIYIARNPKDVSVSYFHFARMLSELKYEGDFANFHEKFVSGRVAYSPWPQHVRGFWENRNKSNVLFLTYEDLHQFPEKCVTQIASFLELNVNKESIERVCFLSKFHNMQRNPNVNYSWWDELGIRKKSESKFLRKGVVGDWKNYYTYEMALKTEYLSKSLEKDGLKFHDPNE